MKLRLSKLYREAVTGPDEVFTNTYGDQFKVDSLVTGTNQDRAGKIIDFRTDTLAEVEWSNEEEEAVLIDFLNPITQAEYAKVQYNEEKIIEDLIEKIEDEVKIYAENRAFSEFVSSNTDYGEDPGNNDEYEYEGEPFESLGYDVVNETDMDTEKFYFLKLIDYFEFADPDDYVQVLMRFSKTSASVPESDIEPELGMIVNTRYDSSTSYNPPEFDKEDMVSAIEEIISRKGSSTLYDSFSENMKENFYKALFEEVDISGEYDDDSLNYMGKSFEYDAKLYLPNEAIEAAIDRYAEENELQDLEKAFIIDAYNDLIGAE